MTKTKLLNTHTRTRGFTLIELLVVISIIGMLSSIVVAEVQSARWTAEGVAEGARARAYVFALESYVNETGRFPTFEPANMAMAACMSNSPICLDVLGGFVVGHHPSMDSIVATYAPGIGDVNAKELLFDIVPGVTVSAKSLFYQCESGNVEMTECVWATVFWYVRGKNCGVESSYSDYYESVNVSYCRYQLGEDPFN